MQIPIVNGIYTDAGPDVRISYPVNMYPVPKKTGISNGYLRPVPGIASWGTGPGKDRGGIQWNGICYRVMGTKFVKVTSNGIIIEIGDVGGTEDSPVSMDYGFDRLAIASGGGLYYFDGTSLTQVTDPDLGTVLDVIWVDGYFMTTDGEFLVVTELTDPTQVNPLKYGSSEADPDPIKAIIKIRNEPYALNRYTIEVFDNVGGDLFPFRRIEGAQIQKGTVGSHSCCEFIDSVAFLGGGRKDSIGVYIATNSNAVKISTDEVDKIIAQFSESQLQSVVLESRTDGSHRFLYVHLPDRTLVFDSASSEIFQEPIWFVLTSSVFGHSQYRGRGFVRAYDKWIVGDPTANGVGYLTDTNGDHWGSVVRVEFGINILYNESRGAIIHELELVSLPGRTKLGKQPYISTSYSVDGSKWSQDKTISAGVFGQTTKRLVWFRQGAMENWRVQRFRMTSDVNISFLRLEAQVEPLAY